MGQGVSQSCFPIQNLLYFQKIIIKFHKSHGILAQMQICWKTALFQYSSFRVIFTLKLAITELTKSMFPWVKGWVNHVFLSKISHFLRISCQNWKKSPNFGLNLGNVKNRDFSVSSKIELFSLKLAVTELPKSRFPWFKGWFNHVFQSKISHILRISHKSWKKSQNFGPNDWNMKNRDFQVSSKIELFTLKLAVSELTKSMFQWFKG